MLRSLLLACALAGVLCITQRAEARPDAQLLTNVAATGTLADGSSFDGHATITSFAFRDGELLASGVLRGSITHADGTVQSFGQHFRDVAADLSQQGGAGKAETIDAAASAQVRCQVLFLDLGPIFLDLLGLELNLSQIVLDLDAVTGSGRLLGNLLCGLVTLLDFPLNLINVINAISTLIDRINDLLANPLQNIPVSAALTDPVSGASAGSFSGVLSAASFAFEGGQLLVNGILEGTATALDGTTQSINQGFEVAADLLRPSGAGKANGIMSAASSSQARCDVLFLDLGPIFLDLLGLELDLSAIELDLDAVSGSGNLLGNLLCAVTGLLDGGPLAGINRLLDRVNDLLDGLLGVLPKADAATLEGAPQSFKLKQNYPNPFNPSTEIAFDLPEASQVELVVFDAVGRVVRTLVNGSMPAGAHQVTFDAQGLPSGLYIYRLSTGEKVEIKQMTLVR